MITISVDYEEWTSWGIFVKVRDLLTVTKCIQAGGGDV